MADFSSESNISSIPLETMSTNFQNIPIHKYNLLEKWIVIWLESDVHEHQGMIESLIKQYCNIVNDVKVFTCVDRCVDFLTDLLDESVCLLLWKPIVHTLLPFIHDSAQLKFVYTLSHTKSDDTLLKNRWRKFQGSFPCIDDIFTNLKQSIRKSEYDLISISTVSPSTIDNTNELDSSFMYSQLLKSNILKIRYNKSSRSEFVDQLRAEYANDSVGLKSVNMLDQTYSDKSPIWWYSKELFIYGPLNHALRTQETEIIIRMGFFIQDLHREIERLHREQRPREKMFVYRGQAMGKNDFEKLQTNQGGLLSFNNFLSTSIDKDVSLFLAESSAGQSDAIGILFQIEINPSISTIPFASVEEFSNYATEKEFLFSMHTICRIGPIKNIQQRVWQVNLTLTDDNDEQLKRITESIRQQIENGSPNVSLGYLLLRMGEYDTAKRIYEKSLISTPDNDVRLRLYLCNILGGIEYAKSAFPAAISYCQKILDMCPLPADCNDIALADIYSNMALAHHASGNYSTAAELYDIVTEMREQSLTSSSFDIATTYNNIAVNYTSMGEDSVALKYFQKSLDLLECLLPPAHPDLCIIYGNIGMINFKLGEREIALKYYEKVLEIQRKSLPSTHQTIAVTLSNLASAYQWIGQYQTAIQYFDNALTIMQTNSLYEHTDFGAIQNNVGQLYKTCGEYDKALPYFLKAIEIQKAICPLGDPKLVVYYVNTAMLYNLLGNFPTAVEYLQKAKEVHQTSPSKTHTDLARIHNGFGLIYQAKKQFWNALHSYQEAIQIQETTFSSTHPDLACIYNNIAGVELDLGREENALDHIQKVLRILEVHLPSNHCEIGRTYYNMGTIYLKMRKYEETKRCFTETSRIYKEALPANHHYFGKFYANLAQLNCMEGKFPAALRHLTKARQILEKVLPSNHPDLVMVYETICRVQQQMSSFGPTPWRF